MNSTCSEFIFALATPNLRAALHLHRLSGNGIFELLSPYIFLPKSDKHLDLIQFASKPENKPYTRYVFIKDKKGFIIDDVIITIYPNPKSFTGEDVIEISCHGNPLLSQQLHSLFRSLGMRDAKAGEFTQRAVLNGKLDLAQAEGINQLIHAESLGAVELARNNVEGILSKETLEIRNEIIKLLAYLEAHIDFAPDEVGDYKPHALLPQVHQIKDKLSSLFKSYQNGLKIREGLKIVLCGKPNSGKSSLYNALLKHDKAIVTAIAGTTRDVLEDSLLIDNKEFVLLDTAGLRDTSDVVEKIGVERSLKSAKEADIICYLISAPELNQETFLDEILNEITLYISEKSQTQKFLIILNKRDILSEGQLKKLSQVHNIFVPSKKTSDHGESIPVTLISQLDYDDLKNKLLFFHKQILEKTDTKKSPMLISQRQKDKVASALFYIQEAENLISIAGYPEKIASLINGAKASLEEIVGEISIDNVFEKIFSTFCIGK